jgi:uncharacterized membrane protein YbhN (UPF0104 family)
MTDLRARLGGLTLGWTVAALVVLSAQLPVLALRWSWLSRRMDVPIPFRYALREYYASTLLNQVLPGGVVGDLFRGLRHGRRAGRAMRAATTLVMDRASGQIALWVLAALSLRSGRLGWLFALAALEAALFFALLAVVRRSRLGASAWDGARIFFAPRVFAVHFGLSLALGLSHVAAFWCVTRGLGVPLVPWTALEIVPPVLIAASLPASFAGWGVREAATAGAYYLSGLAAVDGATGSLVYGALGLVASAPGVLFVVGRSRPRETGQP